MHNEIEIETFEVEDQAKENSEEPSLEVLPSLNWPQKMLKLGYYYSISVVPAIAFSPITAQIRLPVGMMLECFSVNFYRKVFQGIQVLVSEQDPWNYFREMGRGNVCNGWMETQASFSIFSILPTLAGLGMGFFFEHSALPNFGRVLLDGTLSTVLYVGIEELSNYCLAKPSIIQQAHYQTNSVQDVARNLMMRPALVMAFYAALREAVPGITHDFFWVPPFLWIDRILLLWRQFAFIPNPVENLLDPEELKDINALAKRLPNDEVIAAINPLENDEEILEITQLSKKVSETPIRKRQKAYDLAQAEIQSWYGFREVVVWITCVALYRAWSALKVDIETMPHSERVAFYYVFAAVPPLLDWALELLKLAIKQCSVGRVSHNANGFFKPVRHSLELKDSLVRDDAEEGSQLRAYEQWDTDPCLVLN